MRPIWVRLLLAACICAALFVSPAPSPTVAGGLGRWTSFPMQIDGVATTAEWGDAIVQTFGPGAPFEVRSRNDADFFYLLIDVTGDTQADPTTKTGDNINLYLDADKNQALTVGIDRVYFLDYSLTNVLLGSTYIGPGWAIGTPSISFGAAGFGASPASPTPHRVYELALRLSEIKEPPHTSLSVGIYVQSQNPSFATSYPGASDLYDMHNFTTLGLYAQLALYIYNSASPNGYTDYQGFHSQVYAASGIWLESADLGMLEQVDLRPYQAILIGNDAGSDSSPYWLGSPAAAEKLRASGKPVVGIGLGGLGLFSQLGMEIRKANTWSWDPAAPAWVEPTTNIITAAPANPAWNQPLSIFPAQAAALYSNRVAYRAYYFNDPNHGLTGLGGDPRDQAGKHFTLIAERSAATNRTCYTLWGVYGSPQMLTPTGVKLLSNLIANPPCMPSALYIYDDDTATRDQVLTELRNSGFQTASLRLVDLSNPVALAGWDILIAGPEIRYDWTAATTALVRDSRKPVLGMYTGGAKLFQDLGLSIGMNNTGELSNQTGLTITDPFLPSMLHPYPVRVRADQNLPVYSSGVNIAGIIFPTVPFQAMRIGRLPTGPVYWAVTTQSANGVCYMLWGGSAGTSGMTSEGRSLYKNLLIDQPCRYAGFLPAIRR